MLYEVITREYTILLDPPTYIPPPPAGAVMGPTAPAAAAAPPQPMTPATPEPTTPAAVTAAVDYEVVKGDTLSQIARDHMHSDVTFNQMMIAIYRANQEA